MSASPSPHLHKLCLTCSSSIPSKNIDQLFLTECCHRPICLSCLTRNPRLRSYNPCLACLGGVGASSGSGSESRKARTALLQGRQGLAEVNGVAESETFVLGDSDNDDEGSEDGIAVDAPPTFDDASAPPPYAASQPPRISSTVLSVVPSLVPEETVSESTSASSSDPYKYYIGPEDTLLSIALKLRIDARKLARLNNLPTTVLSTTPHLLHTRRYLNLPKSDTRSLASSPTPPNSLTPAEREAHAKAQEKEQAAKRFAFVTKVVDYHVAKAYVELGEEFSEEDKEYGKEVGRSAGDESRLGRAENSAVARYLEDNEWEAAEIRAGRLPRPQGFPFVSNGSTGYKG